MPRWILFGLTIAGCTPASPILLQAPDESDRAEIVVFREPALSARTMRMVFGADGNDYLILKDGEYARVYVSPKTYEFFVRSVQADRPHRLALSLGPRESRCLKAYANPDNVVKALLPPLHYVGATFLLEETSCPSTAELATRYSWVPVDYEAGGGN